MDNDLLAADFIVGLIAPHRQFYQSHVRRP